MTFQQWMQIVGPIIGMLFANFVELRKLRATIDASTKTSIERHGQTTMRLDGHEERISKLERA